MGYLLGFEEWADYWQWNREQRIVFILVIYIDILIYALIMVLILRNTWVVIIKQRVYKNLPILMFYIFAFIAVSIRLIDIIGYWTYTQYLESNIDLLQQAAKICVGMVQDWITFELAIRFHNSKVSLELSKASL